MEKEVSLAYEFKRYYLAEFEFFDGDEFVTFNIVGIDVAKNEITVAVTDRGKISIITKYMGRRDSTVTLQVYAHFIPDTKEKVVNALNNII